MEEIIIKIVFAVIIAIAIVCAIIVLKTRADSSKAKKAAFIIEMLMLVVAALPYFINVSIGDIVIYYGNAEQLEEMENNYAAIIAENAKLNVQLEEKDSKISDLNAELDEIKENRKYAVEFLNYELYKGDEKKNVNLTNSVAKINGTLFFSQEAFEGMVGDSLNMDVDDKIIYIGKHPDKQEDLLSVCEPYDPSRGFILGKDKTFKIHSDPYSSGIRLDAYYNDLRTVKFNLREKYSELSFKIGHIDDTGQRNSFILNIYTDDEERPVKHIVCGANVDVDELQTVPLNYGKTLILEWTCDSVDSDYDTSYGLIDLKLK